MGTVTVRGSDPSHRCLWTFQGRVEGFGIRIQELGFSVQSIGVWALGFKVVWALGIGNCGWERT